ncbi:hypothetical protein PQX77_014802 [Marasmius sp. AFHP31]|nr:hypothetical protein PQX77_014802 [Marasmius sp. AFHP31]
MLTVNSTFFRLAMDERYKDLSLYQLEGNMVDYLLHLSSPFIMHRVRTLRLRPYFMQQLQEAQVAGLLGEGLYNEIIRRLENLLLNFTHLRECHIAWYSNDTHLFHGVATQSLLQKAISSSTRLRKLSLVLSLSKLEGLLTPDVRAATSDLDELEISILSDDGLELPCPPLEQVVVDSLIPFISRSQRHLTVFAFGASVPLDFSLLFHGLTNLPHLRLQHLSLSIPCTAPYLGTPHALSSFLNAHSQSLARLALHGSHIEPSERRRGQARHPDLANWLEPSLLSCDDTNLSPSLEHLTFSTSFLPIGTAISCVRRYAHSPSFTSLDLTGRYMSYQQVKKLFSGTDNGATGTEMVLGVRKLRLGTVSLSPELVDLMAEKLPKLEEVDMWIRDVRPHKNDVPVYDLSCTTTKGLAAMGRVKRQVQVQIDWFRVEMQKRKGIYKNWTGVRHVAVWKFSGKMRIQREYGKMIVECLPLASH